MKKKILALALASLAVAPVYADTAEGDMNHMLTFDADSILQGAWSFQKSKVPGRSTDNDSALNLNLNYFYALPSMRNIQVGGSVNYGKATNFTGDNENYGFMVGGIYNFSDNLPQSFYAKLLVGMDWNKEYAGSSGNTSDEVLKSTFALGKRMSLANWGLKHLTYTPEIALTNSNSTTGGNFEYSQAVELRFLQFAVFF